MNIPSYCLLLLSLTAEGANDKLLNAISWAESKCNPDAIGDDGKAVSAYQLHEAAWHDANLFRIDNGQRPISRDNWRDPNAARQIAASYCDLIHLRLKLAKVEPTPANIYAAYTCGFASFKSYGFNIKRLPKVKQNGIARMLKAFYN